MANIPGISGYIQPGAFARDRVISKAASIPGGLRVAAIMGEGKREEVLVESAVGGGQDGSASCSPSGSGESRYFKLSRFPVVSGRTELYLNGTKLFGKEEAVDESVLSHEYDYRIDTETGCIELQKATIKDQNGRVYSASGTNIGNGSVPDEGSTVCSTVDIVDSSAPTERWTLKCVSVVRDSSGSPVPGRATFSVTGSASGQAYDDAGSPIFFHSTYFTSSTGAVAGNSDPSVDGYVVATSDDYGLASPVSDGGATLDTTNTVTIPADVVSDGQALVGDYLVLEDGTYGQISSMTYDAGTTTTTIVVSTDTLGSVGDTVEWKIRAVDAFIDQTMSGLFTGLDVGKLIVVCPAGSFAGGKFVITKVTSANTVRVLKYGETDVVYPSQEATDTLVGLAYEDLTFYMVETNGIIQAGIQEGAVPFEVGDRLFIDVSSRAMGPGDKLVANYIYEADLNDPELFTDAESLFAKHGFPSVENTIALGAQIAFENGAPAIMAVQCKPSVPRRTSATLLSQVSSAGVGGFTGCLTSLGVIDDSLCGLEDLRFVIPAPTTGLLMGRPAQDTRVNIFIKRDGVETQIFPNKVDFYNSQLETDAQQLAFISGDENPFSYTIVNSDTNTLFTGEDGVISTGVAGTTLSSLFINLDRDHVGSTIVIESMEDLSGNIYTSVADISEQLYGTGVGVTETAEVLISEISSDTKAVIVGAYGNTLTVSEKFVNAQFFIKGESTTSVSASLLLHKDLVKSGTIKKGDGIRITYIDENDASFYDTNWFTAFEKLEAVDAQIIVPLPSSTISAIFQSAVTHCETMSSIANRKERVAIFGAQSGLSTDAILGIKEVAVEDIGIIEGIQGDDPLELLSGDIEDLADYKLSSSYDSSRAVYLYPDSIVRNVSGTNVQLHGFYMAPALAGLLSANQNVSIPVTNKTLTGFSLTRDKVYRPVILDKLGGEGATVVQPIPGGGRILAGRTTSQSGVVEEEEISIVFIRDRVKQVLRNSLKSFIGGVQGPDTLSLMSAKTKTIMTGLSSQGLITSFSNIRVARDKVDPRQLNVFLQFVPAYPINFVFIDLEVGVV